MGRGGVSDGAGGGDCGLLCVMSGGEDLGEERIGDLDLNSCVDGGLIMEIGVFGERLTSESDGGDL